ncbi:hypothetical protein [Halorussus amylolyticus]|uniref:hypothetical protein n=1 Tax=Halorussus amylolyticus TaxID=1126242 RepID=UPI0010476FA8|nr:hypothetical protein [Halorussus amylolyticus]
MVGLLTLALVWNAAALGYVAVPDSGPAADASPADNSWDMFAPEPLETDGWYVVPGELESGERIDAFRGSAVEWDRPENVSRIYPDSRWRKYLVDLWRAEDADLTRGFAEYLCWRWNADNDDELTRVEVHYVEQPTRLDGPEPTRRVELGRYSCSVVDSGR